MAFELTYQATINLSYITIGGLCPFTLALNSGVPSSNFQEGNFNDSSITPEWGEAEMEDE